MLTRKWLMVSVLLMVLASCRKDQIDPATQKSFNLSGFNQVYLSEKINLVIEHGEAFSIKAKGPAADINRLELKLTDNGQTLDIACKEGTSSGVVDMTITLPVLLTAFIDGEAVTTIRGFADQSGMMGLVLSGKARTVLHGGATALSVEVTGNAELTLNGTSGSLSGLVSYNGIVNAFGMSSTHVSVSTTHHAKAHVWPVHIFYASAADESRVFYKGDPANKQMETSGNGQVIKE